MIELSPLETPASIASHYDDLDDFYREIWGLHVHHGLWITGRESSPEATENLLRHLLQGLELGPGKRVCDIGCGYGETARYISRHTGASVVGVSVSGKQVEMAKTLSGNFPVEILLRDWMDNKFPDESFDVALSVESSEHMPDFKKFFSEAHRILRPGGAFRICAWLSAPEQGMLGEKLLLSPICREGRIRLGAIDDYKEQLRQAGFSNIQFEDLTDQVKRTWTLCLFRCAWKFLTDPKYFRFILSSPSKNKNFLFSLLRIRIAYEFKAMRYGIFKAVRSDG